MLVPKKLRELINNLTFDENVWWISITVPTGLSSEELLRHLRSKIPEVLEEKEIHSRVKQQLRTVIKTTHTYIRDYISSTDTNGFFTTIRFNLELLERSDKASVKNILDFHTFNLDSKPSFKVVLSHIPDLTFAINHFTSEKSHLILTVDPQESHLYKLHKDNLVSRIWRHVNKFIKPEHNRYYQKVSMTRNQSIRHGTGAEKVTRVLNSGEKLFVSNELKEISKKYSCNAFSILLSHKYSARKDLIASEAQELFPDSQVQVLVGSSDGFSQLNRKSIIKYGIADNTDSDSIPSPSHPNSLTRLHSVSKALKNGRVDTLYLQPEITYEAFVHPNAESFTYPVKDSRKVDSIRPWLIKSALTNSTKVAVISNNEEMQKPVIATTRY